jgi:hypothetical protein
MIDAKLLGHGNLIGGVALQSMMSIHQPANGPVGSQPSPLMSLTVSDCIFERHASAVRNGSKASDGPDPAIVCADVWCCVTLD